MYMIIRTTTTTPPPTPPPTDPPTLELLEELLYVFDVEDLLYDDFVILCKLLS